MFNGQILANLQENFEKRRLSFKKEDIAYIAGKDTFKGKMLGFLTTDYYRREKLIRGGEIIYGYIYRTWTNEITFTKPYPTWVLFSPSKEFVNNPNLYVEILTALQAIELPKRGENELRKLHTMLNAELSEPRYMVIPEPYAQGHLVYLSMAYLRPHHNSNLRLGINPFLIAPAISKEILHLPTKYWTEEFKKIYHDL
jgi:hypothetical protein